MLSPNGARTDRNIIVAVLDWGLGHASRCIPLVKQLQAKGNQVTIASAGHALELLKTSFLDVNLLELPPYGISYPSHSMVWNMLRQGPSVLQTVSQERKILKQYILEHKMDTILSDGRFGCYHESCENIWMAHQLQIQHSSEVLAGLLNKGYHNYIRQRFNEVWVPDWEDSRSIAGVLSKAIPGLPHQYLGPLSRFNSKDQGSTHSYKYDYLALLSGPEPQRTYLEEEVRKAFVQTGRTCLLIRGVPGSTEIRPHNNKIDEVDWLYGDDLEQVVYTARQIICRSGYSTLMDLYYWQKSALFIPTPGQTEQEYLAKYWTQKGWAKWQKQGAIHLSL